ncbi:GNAT family N-acetyltransferase [Streptomyces sp. NPDC054962]
MTALYATGIGHADRSRSVRRMRFRPAHRGLGYGRALWRAAMHWGYRHGAAYQLLQTEVGGASDRLCAGEGLTSLGIVNQQDA